MYEEEKGWFITLKQKGEHQARLTDRYCEEYERYTGAPARQAA
jgi:hypothetical protein